MQSFIMVKYFQTKILIYFGLASLPHVFSLKKPEVNPKNISVPEGDDVTFHCVVNFEFQKCSLYRNCTNQLFIRIFDNIWVLGSFHSCRGVRGKNKTL